MKMKSKAVFLFAAVILVLALAFSAAAPAAPNAKALPAPGPQPAAASPAPDHPEIHEAIAALRHAREHLEHARHDFGGHRAEAIRATDEAIHQLEICLKFDRD
jgi:Spy/CpxP family protein refolding chaperone